MLTTIILFILLTRIYNFSGFFIGFDDLCAVEKKDVVVSLFDKVVDELVILSMISLLFLGLEQKTIGFVCIVSCFFYFLHVCFLQFDDPSE